MIISERCASAVVLPGLGAGAGAGGGLEAAGGLGDEEEKHRVEIMAVDDGVVRETIIRAAHCNILRPVPRGEAIATEKLLPCVKTTKQEVTGSQ